MKKQIQHGEIQKAAATLQEKCPNVTVNEDALFDEVTSLQEFLKWDHLKNVRNKMKQHCQRWSTVFIFFQDNAIQHTNLSKLSSVAMCLPGSNAPVEGVFSQMNDTWTASRNRFTVYTIKAMLIVRKNFILPCLVFTEKLAKDRAILRKIHSSEKYAD